MFTTAETFAITDWGRGKQAGARKLVESAGGTMN